jgi:Mn2+/Fe2+ NRAMP family transporter
MAAPSSSAMVSPMSPNGHSTANSEVSAGDNGHSHSLVAAGTVGGTALSLLHVKPIKLLVLVAVINGVAAAPFLVVVMSVSSSKRIMGDYVNGNAAKILGWLAALAGMARAGSRCSQALGQARLG